jgi:hypothetical protein
VGAAHVQDDPARREVLARDGHDIDEAAGATGDPQQRRTVDRGDHGPWALVGDLTRMRIGGWRPDGVRRVASGVENAIRTTALFGLLPAIAGFGCSYSPERTRGDGDVIVLGGRDAHDQPDQAGS